MGFEVETLKFEGPLDLMLHLIREQQLDIFDLDMTILTDQYIAYLNRMEKLELEIESEYLVELATLIEYKSKKLLPKPVDDLDDEYEEDPKERLVRRLLEYQKFKDVSALLGQAYLDRQSQISKAISVMDFSDTEEEKKLEGNPYDLFKAMNKVLRRLELSKPVETKYTARELSLQERVLQIKANLINFSSTFTFWDICADCRDIREYLVTFLAVLDMAKDHILVFSVDDNDEIYFSRGVADE